MSTAKTEKFEDLIAWQKARELTRNIYQVTTQGNFSRDFWLRDQIRRASVSIMSNIAEGFERAGRSEFHQFLVIAKGSCAELRSQLYVSLGGGGGGCLRPSVDHHVNPLFAWRGGIP